MLDVLLDLRREHQFTGEDVDAIDVGGRSNHADGADSRPSGHRTPGQVQHAVLRRGRRVPRPRRHRHVSTIRRCAIRRSTSVRRRVSMSIDSRSTPQRRR
jgi:hypothetical protein